MVLFRYVIALVVILLSNTIYADSRWVLSKSEGDIQVYLRDMPGSVFDEFKGVSRIKASVDALVAVMNDTAACPEWFYQCQKPMDISRVGFNNRYQYQVSDFPFIVSDREILFHLTAHNN